MKHTTTILVCTVFLSGLFWEPLVHSQENQAEKDLMALKGKWVLVRVLEKGKERPPSVYDTTEFTFFSKKGTVSRIAAGEDDEGTFTIDASKNPGVLNVKFSGWKTPWPHIYKFQGDELWISWGPQEGPLPAGFKNRATIYKRPKK
jgi:uncharacterized protein (TIGR03067 family)